MARAGAEQQQASLYGDPAVTSPMPSPPDPGMKLDAGALWRRFMDLCGGKPMGEALSAFVAEQRAEERAKTVEECAGIAKVWAYSAHTSSESATGDGWHNDCAVGIATAIRARGGK